MPAISRVGKWVVRAYVHVHALIHTHSRRINNILASHIPASSAKSRADLERYLHYFNRYANHGQSARLATQFQERTEKKMEEMQQTVYNDVFSSA